MSRRSDPQTAGFFCLVLGGMLIYRSIKKFQRYRKIQDVARIDIASAPQGLIEVEGYAWPLNNSITAVCGREAVYYNYKVQKLVRRGKNASWETEYEFNFDKTFYVIDRTGACFVQPVSQATEDVSEKITKLSGYAADIESLRQVTRPANFLSQLFTSSYRLVEKKILVGSPVYVNGEMQMVNSPEQKIKGDYKRFINTALSSQSNLWFQIQRFDSNHDGKISDQELLEGISDLAKAAVKESKEEKIKVAGLIADTPNHSLILADCHQQELLKKMSTFNNLKIFFGIILIAVGAYILKLNI